MLSKDVKEFCTDFCASTDISYFHHIRVFNNRQAFILSNNPQYIEYFLEQKFAVSEPGTYTKPGMHLWTGLKSLRNFDNQSRDMQQYFNISHQISFVVPQTDYIDIFTLGANNNKPEIVNYYINNRDVLEKMFTRYRDHFEKDLNNLNDAQIILPLRPNNNAIIHAKSADLLSQLTARELNCLNLIASGHTAKTLARILNISHRTGERHIDNIRNKLNIRNKYELINFYYKHSQQRDYL